jgi:multidrug transporter EmrE-like cation transporter
VGYFYIFGTIFFTVYGQLVLKWRISQVGALPDSSFLDKVLFLGQLLFDPWIFSGFLSAFIASFFWMAAMTKFELSFAYPFMSGAFVLVFILSVLLFHEAITWQKIVGLLLIVSGIFVTSQSL